MKKTIKATRIEITDSLRVYLDRKIFSSLMKRLTSVSDGAVTVDIELSRDTAHHKKGDVFRAEATILIPPRHQIRAEAKAPDIRSAIDMLESALMRKLSLYKGRATMSPRRRARKDANAFHFNEMA